MRKRESFAISLRKERRYVTLAQRRQLNRRRVLGAIGQDEEIAGTMEVDGSVAAFKKLSLI